MPLKVSPLIGSRMVLPQGAAVPIRGQAAPGAEAAVSFLGKTYRAQADSTGAWRLFLDGSPPGGPYAMEITAAGEKIALDDIYIGGVWLCSGQSNMEMPMQRVKDNFPEEWLPPVNALIRQFKVPQEWEFSGPRAELSGGCWQAADAHTLYEFSAAAWFFARALYEKHPGPIGLITAAWGGTPIEAWMSREALEASAVADFPAKIAGGSQYADAAKRAGITEKTAGAIEAWETNLAHEDAGLPHDWKNPATDISAWGGITLPGDFSAAGLEGFCGVLWLAKDIEVSAAFAASGAALWLGTITDADTVYVNGVEVGNTAYRYPPRKYPVNAGLLKEGKNRIAIRVTCNSGEGGVTDDKPFRIFTHNEILELAGTWKYQIGAAAAQRPAEFFFQRQSMGLFNAMIAPVLDYPLTGVIWYQGESNDPNPHEYAALFPALINDWRKRNGSPLPFLFVQLPLFGEPQDGGESSSWAVIRAAQAQALSLPATGMAAGLDLGEWNDLHPLDKKGIGRRLALAAEKTVYGAPNTSPGPMVRGVERRGGRLFITFDNCGKGIISKEDNHGVTRSFKREREEEDNHGVTRSLRKREEEDEKGVVVGKQSGLPIRSDCGQRTPFLPLSSSLSFFSVLLRGKFFFFRTRTRTPPVHLTVIAAGGETFRVPVNITGPDCVSVDISAVKNPEKVLYAWANNPRGPLLFNSDGLPVIPFRIKLQ